MDPCTKVGMNEAAVPVDYKNRQFLPPCRNGERYSSWPLGFIPPSLFLAHLSNASRSIFPGKMQPTQVVLIK